MAQPEKVVPLADSVHPDTQPLAASHHTLSGHVLAPVDPAAGPRVGMMLGPYQLLEPLGQGGMGQVWRAQQTAPLKREVAVKLLSRSLDDRIAEAWFLVERQALAMLVHPYIAQIYDAGQLPGGLMFFAMELVEGQTLDRWACDQLPDLPRLVALFERICQGIQHAHQRGLIHRDLKPANILVGEHQGEALPKIIDFGVAIGAGGGSQSTAGTRAYMAPEQARPDGRGIDARADVYGLGATLAALLCLRSGIRADGSTALSHLHAAAHASSLSRHGEHGGGVTAEQVQRLRRSVPRALRAILLKATAAEREQRYDSAAALAEDLRRWRSGHPVLAMGGGRAYAIGCFLRRNSWASAAAGVALLALLSGIAAALYGLTEARSAQALAEQRRVQAEGLVGAMLGDLADKLRPLGRLDLLETVGEEAMRYLTAAQASDSGGAVQRARALRTLGEVYVQRQQTDRARDAFNEAAQTLDAADPAHETASDLHFERGQVAFWLGNLDMNSDSASARQHFERYLEAANSLIALDPSNLVAQKEVGYALSNLALLELAAGLNASAVERFDEAIEVLSTAYRSAPDDEGLAQELSTAISYLGTQLESSGDPAAALLRFERQLHLLSALPSTDANVRYRLALALHHNARLTALLGGAHAHDQIGSALVLLRDLVSLDESNQTWRLALASALVQAGEISMIRHEVEQPIALFDEARKMAESLVDADGARAVGIRLRAELRSAIIAWQWGNASVERHLLGAEALIGKIVQGGELSTGSLRDFAVYRLLCRRLSRSTIAGIDSFGQQALDTQKLDAKELETRLANSIEREGPNSDSVRDMHARIEKLGYNTDAFEALIGEQ